MNKNKGNTQQCTLVSYETLQKQQIV